MLRMLLALVLSTAIVLLTGPKLIAWLHKLNFGQTIYDLGPKTHQKKQGTPNMGGICIALGTVLAGLVCSIGLGQAARTWQTVGMLLFVALGSMAVGFADDWIKVVKKRHEGLTPWQKIAGQILVCVGFAVMCYLDPEVGHSIRLPFSGAEWDLGLFYIPLLALTVLFMVNSANLQDGLDGLLSSVTAVGSVGWTVVGLLLLTLAEKSGVVDHSLIQVVMVFAMALCGGCIGFLRFNHYPATVFMGDNGSMFIGGLTVGFAMLLREPFLLLLIDFTLVMSSASVILQRYYYKATRKIYGQPRRLFKMSPIHHHFEMCGMKETQIDWMYAGITLALSVVAVLAVAIPGLVG